MDVNGLRAPLGALRKCHIREHSPIVTIRGRGDHDMLPLFPSSFIHLSGGFGFKPWHQQKINYLCEGTIPMLMLTFLSHYLAIQLDLYYISHDGKQLSCHSVLSSAHNPSLGEFPCPSMLRVYNNKNISQSILIVAIVTLIQ